MAKEETKKVTLLKKIVVEGEICEQGDEVSVSKEDSVFLIGCGKAADPKSDEAKDAVEAAKKAKQTQKAA